MVGFLSIILQWEKLENFDFSLLLLIKRLYLHIVLIGTIFKKDTDFQ